MPLLGCFVTPHPPIVLPEVGGAEAARVDATFNAMREVGDEAKRLDPQTIVLLSPHSPLARSQMGVSIASSYRGSFAYFHAPQVRLTAESDRNLAKAIADEASVHGIPVVATASPDEVVDLDHGTMVPLYFLANSIGKTLRLVILSFSYLSMDEHVRFGQAVGRVLISSPTRTVYVASADLSHRLIPGAPAGYDARAPQFDHAVADTFARGDWEGLMSIDAGVVQAAGECGYRSLAVLSGVVDAVRSVGGSAENKLLSYEGPFGVGYLVGTIGISFAERAAADRTAEVTS